jgi:hypothetical protein
MRRRHRLRRAGTRLRIRAVRRVVRIRRTSAELARAAARRRDAIVAAVGRGRARLAARFTVVRAWLGVQAIRLRHLGMAVSRAAVVVIVASLVVAAAAYAASRFHEQYSSGQQILDTRTWAVRTPDYSGSTCASCHPDQAETQAAGPHRPVACEVCHGPQGDHPRTASGTVASMAISGSSVCLTCHALTAGRPTGYPQVDPATHYSANDCLRCHEGHAVYAVAPPDVTHPLALLPPCTTCHAPNGLTKLPAGHEMVADAVCLSCHAVPTGGG